MNEPTSPITVKGACHHDCPDTCSWEATVAAGRVVRLRGSADHPITQGQLCPKVNRFVDRVYHHDRLRTPLRRIGSKGAGEFEPISWDEALAVVASRLEDVAQISGPKAILQFSFDGTEGLVQKGVMADRFFDTIGASDIHRHLCGVSSWLGAAEVSGLPYGIDPEDLRHSKTIILWGTNTLLTNRHLWRTIEQAKQNGATVVVIDPIRTPTAAAAEVDRFVQIRPGTDVALVLAMINLMDREGLLDEQWLADNTVGAADLRTSAVSMPPSKASAITGLSVEEVEWLARIYVHNQPSAIRVLVGPEHRQHGRELMRAIAILPAVTGAWRKIGGGLARSTQVYHETALNMPQDRPERRTFNMGLLGEVLDDAKLDPPVNALIVHNSNPAVVCPDQNKVIRGLSRDDLFTVVLEQFMTDTARYADIILPVTTQLEHLELMLSWGHMYLTLNQPAIEPVGESLPNTEIFRRLAAVMKLEAPGLADRDEDLVRSLLDSQHPWLQGISFEGLQETGWARLNVPPGHRPYVDSRPETADGLLQLGSLTYRPGAETAEGDPKRAARYPLTLMSRKQHVKFLNANYGGFPEHFPRAGGPRLEIHPVDAAARGIQDGDQVEVCNDRGTLVAPAILSEDVQPGVVAIPFGWWNRSTQQDRSVNVLTNAAVAPDGQGSSFFHENLVEVRQLDIS